MRLQKIFVLDLSIVWLYCYHVFDQKIDDFHLKYKNNVDTCYKQQRDKLFYICERENMHYVKR